MDTLSHLPTPTGHTSAARARKTHREPIPQTLTLVLDGITSDDYLQWVRDPDPPDRRDLKLIMVRSAPVTDRIQLDVISDGEMPPATIAAHALGFPITADVASVDTHDLGAPVISLRPRS